MKKIITIICILVLASCTKKSADTLNVAPAPTPKDSIQIVNAPK